MKRTVAAITTSRADYGHLRWVLEDLRVEPDVEPRLIVTGAHLTEEFGRTVSAIEKDGQRIDERVECLISSDSDVGMAKTIGVATLGLAEVLGRMRPDLLLLIADRYEMLAPASVALALRIPVAHIEGGDVSAGAIDDAVRNALTKMSHLHFTPTETATRRVLAMGEEPWRVHHVGAPSLDYLERLAPLADDVLRRRLGLAVAPDAVLVSYHPVTLARDTLVEADGVFSALESLDRQILFCFPNADAGSRELVRRATELCERRPTAGLFVNLDPETYWSLLRRVGVMVGNSSSGIMETPSLGLPTVNVGRRQEGRERAPNVLDAPPLAGPLRQAVERALEPEFRASLVESVNPYGDGSAAQKIVRILADCPLGDELLFKKPIPVNDLN